MPQGRKPSGHEVAPPAMRDANRALLLRLLRRHQPVSRADISRRAGLSEGTVSRIVAGLVDEHLVAEHGAQSSGLGRPGTKLELDDRHITSIGVEIQNWETRVSRATLRGRLIETRVFRTPRTPEDAIELAAAECRNLCGRRSITHIAGVGVSVRGVVNHQTGTVVLGSSTSWNDVRVGALLSARLRMPVWVENNVRAAALAEFNPGPGEPTTARTQLYVRIDEGIGAGILFDGALYRGPHMSAGELGQMLVKAPAGSGREDRPGCLESLASNPAIVRTYDRLSHKRRKSSPGDSSARVKALCRQAMDGDPIARRALEVCTQYLGAALANLVWLLDADTVVVDGAITAAWPLVSAAIRDQWPQGSEFFNFRDLVLRPANLGPDAPLVGAALLPFQPLFAAGRLDRSSFPDKEGP